MHSCPDGGAACRRTVERVKTLKGKSPCCGSWNSLTKVDKKGIEMVTKRREHKR